MKNQNPNYYKRFGLAQRTILEMLSIYHKEQKEQERGRGFKSRKA